MRRLTLTIPDTYRAPFRDFITMEPAARDALLGALRNAEPTVSLVELASLGCVAAGLDRARCEGILEMLQSMYVIRSSRSIPMPQFVDAIVQAAGSDLAPPDADWNRFKEQLAQFLSLDNSLGLAAKAFEVRQESQKLFCDARFLSDLRPIFRDDVDEGPFGFTILHTLRLSYHAGSRLSDIFVSFGREDLKKLERIVQRALAKEESLRRRVENVGLRCFDVESH